MILMLLTLIHDANDIGILFEVEEMIERIMTFSPDLKKYMINLVELLKNTPLGY